MIRLLHVTTVPMTLRFLTGQVGYMKTRGFDIHALSSPGHGLAEFQRAESVPCHAVDMPRRITPFRDLRALVHVWRVLKRLRPDIVHAHTPKGGLLGMLSAWIARVPVRVYHIHGLPMDTARGVRRRLLSMTEQVSCGLATQVFCVSHSVRDVAITRRLCEPGKIKVLAGGSINGVDAQHKFNPASLAPMKKSVRARYDIPAPAKVVGYIGRIVRDKGIMELADAWERVRSEVKNACLLIVGPEEEQDPIPETTMQQLATDSSVFMVGPVWDTPPLFAAMDMVVLPSYREGLPVVPLEAAAMALPVVATDIPGCSDAVRDGVTGTLIPVQDPDALADSILKYLKSPELLRRHGGAGRERVLREFRQEVIWEETYREYRRLLAEVGVKVV